MSVFSEKLNSFTMSELSELLEDDDKLSSIITEMDEMLEVQQIKELTLASNRSLAEQNLQLQPDLDHQKNQLTQQYQRLQELYNDYQLRKSTLDQSSGNSSLDTLLALLQAEGAKIEEETEIMADSFLDGDLSLDCFIEDYQRRRCLAHHRRVKIDKLQEIVLNGLNQPAQANSFSANHPSVLNRLQDLPTSPSYHTNGSSSPLNPRASPTHLAQAQPIALPYPASPYPYLSSGYPGSYMAQPYRSPSPQHHSPSACQPGFILQ